MLERRGAADLVGEVLQVVVAMRRRRDPGCSCEREQYARSQPARVDQLPKSQVSPLW